MKGILFLLFLILWVYKMPFSVWSFSEKEVISSFIWHRVQHMTKFYMHSLYKV